MNHLNLRAAKAVYNRGDNVTQYLRREFDESANTSQIIEIAYDLQAGSYIDFEISSPQPSKLRAAEMYTHLAPHLSNDCSILDVGSGELTTLSHLSNEFGEVVSEIYAFDISFSRLFKGLGFWAQTVTLSSVDLTVFVADIKKIPLANNSIDVVISSHALEPNGSNLLGLLSEIFRVAKDKCVFFEPSYELNSEEGKQRMDRLGYIKDLEATVQALGGRLISSELMENVCNPLNPTACYVIQPPTTDNAMISAASKLCVPGTSLPLILKDGFMQSADTGLVFPVLNDIPVLKENSAILATSLFV